jgi:hypothetical protein
MFDVRIQVAWLSENVPAAAKYSAGHRYQRFCSFLHHASYHGFCDFCGGQSRCFLPTAMLKGCFFKKNFKKIKKSENVQIAQGSEKWRLGKRGIRPVDLVITTLLHRGGEDWQPTIFALSR